MAVEETTPEHINRMADDGAGNLRLPPAIEAQIETEFSELGTVITDPDDLPANTSIRLSGGFTDSQDALGYLERGGLATVTETGEHLPTSFVYFVQYWDEVLFEYVYQTYISDDSGV